MHTQITVVRVSLLVAIAAVAACGALALSGPSRVSACSRWSISATLIPETVRKSPIVAIGEFVDAKERSATFRVDESLKGAAAGSTIEIDNRTAYTAMACSPYEEPFRDGFRFNRGDKKILMLEKEVDGLWQVGFYSDTAWSVPSDELQPLIQDFWVDQAPLPRLDAVRADIQALTGKLGSDLDFEGRTPCNPSQDLQQRIISSTVVVIAEVETGAEHQVVRVKEVIAGDAPAEFTVNHRVRRDYDRCDVVLEPARQPGQREVTTGQYLLFLRPDEFGIADYRPALWGSAVEHVNERYLTENLPTLHGIRTAITAQGHNVPSSPGVPGVAPVSDSSPTASPRVTSAAVELEDENRFTRWYVFVGGAAIVAAGVLASWRWQARRTRL